jgi:hypothetical protein
VNPCGTLIAGRIFIARSLSGLLSMPLSVAPSAEHPKGQASIFWGPLFKKVGSIYSAHYCIIILLFSVRSWTNPLTEPSTGSPREVCVRRLKRALLRLALATRIDRTSERRSRTIRSRLSEIPSTSDLSRAHGNVGGATRAAAS